MRARSHLLWRFLRPENGVHLNSHHHEQGQNKQHKQHPKDPRGGSADRRLQVGPRPQPDYILHADKSVFKCPSIFARNLQVRVAPKIGCNELAKVKERDDGEYQVGRHNRDQSSHPKRFAHARRTGNNGVVVPDDICIQEDELPDVVDLETFRRSETVWTINMCHFRRTIGGRLNRRLLDRNILLDSLV